MTKKRFEPNIQYFNQAFALVSEGLLFHDKKGAPLFANPSFCHIFGASEREILDKGLNRLFPPESLSRFQKKILPESEKFGIGKEELEGINQTNSRFPLSISTVPVKDDSGEITGYASLCQDLSEEMEIRRRRLHSEKLAAIGEMLAGVAHELNNPLTSVVGGHPNLQDRAKPALRRTLAQTGKNFSRRERRPAQCAGTQEPTAPR